MGYWQLEDFILVPLASDPRSGKLQKSPLRFLCDLYRLCGRFNVFQFRSRVQIHNPVTEWIARALPVTYWRSPCRQKRAFDIVMHFKDVVMHENHVEHRGWIAGGS